MSFEKMGKTLPKKSARALEKEIAILVKESLRADFPNLKLAAKAVAQETEVKTEAIKKWYNGQNAPSSWHFMVLIKISPSLFKALIQSICPSDLASTITEAMTNQPYRQNDGLPRWQQEASKNVMLNVTINPKNAKLNARQRWFLGRIYDNQTTTIEDFVSRWTTTERTVRRDIAILIRLGIIRRAGAKKNGRYVLAVDPANSAQTGGSKTTPSSLSVF